MKFQKLLASIAVFSLATGAVGAFAEETCDDRIITDTIISGDITVIGKDCYISDVTVEGNVTVLNAQKFTMKNTRVLGDITVRASGDVTINDTNATGYEVRTAGNERVELTAVMAKKLAVNNNGVAYVVYNAASHFVCKRNIRLVADMNEGPNARRCDTIPRF